LFFEANLLEKTKLGCADADAALKKSFGKFLPLVGRKHVDVALMKQA